jgi:hypothetical protein
MSCSLCLTVGLPDAADLALPVCPFARAVAMRWAATVASKCGWTAHDLGLGSLSQARSGTRQKKKQ